MPGKMKEFLPLEIFQNVLFSCIKALFIIVGTFATP